jgi:hypothetical protein
MPGSDRASGVVVGRRLLVYLDDGLDELYPVIAFS